MTRAHLTTFALCIAAALSSAASLAQTNISPQPIQSQIQGGGTSSPPAQAPSPSTADAPSRYSGTTLGRGPDEALATPDDRAQCAMLSGTAKGDCIAHQRRQREADERMRSTRGTAPGGDTRTR